MRFWVALICALFATQAGAGAWPRAEGTVFLSFSHRLGISTRDPYGEAPTQYTALYIEYGLSQRLTLGIDAGRSISGGQKAIVFANLPFLKTKSGHHAAVQLGYGQIDKLNTVRPGLSYGYGFQSGDLSGWATADLLAEIKGEAQETDLKLDLTFGLSWPQGFKAYAQVQTGRPAGQDPFARIAGNVVVPTRFGFSADLGLEMGILNDPRVQLKIGVWREF